MAKLTNGIVFQRKQGGVVKFSINLKQIGDWLAAGVSIIDSISDGTNTMVTLEVPFKEPIIIEGNGEDNSLSLTISDDLSGLISFTAIAIGATEI